MTGPRTPVRSRWALAIASIPLVQLAAMQPAMIGFLQAARSPGGRASDATSALISVGAALNLAVGVILIGVTGLLALLDHRRLRTAVERPFPWGWGFLHHLVYLIGRTVVLHRRGRPDAAPLVLVIALFAGGFVVLLIEFGFVVGPIVADPSILR